LLEGHPEGWTPDAVFGALKPLGELEGEELAKEGPGGGAGEEVAGGPYDVRFLFIISINGTIKSHSHELVEGMSPRD